MNFKKLKRLASAMLSFSMLLSMNVTAFAIDLNTVTEAESGSISVLAELATRAETAKHKQMDSNGNLVDADPVWSDWEVQAEPGCETSGYKMRHCTVEFCYEVDVEELDPVGHNYTEGTVVTAASCGGIGIKKVICQNSPEMHGSVPTEEEVEIPRTPHNFTGGTESKIPATCKASGKKGIACTYGCGELDPATIVEDATAPATGHSYKAVDPTKVNTAEDLSKLTSNPATGITVTAATCITGGSLVLECKNKDCDGTDAEKRIEKTIPASGHSYSKHLNGKDLDTLTTEDLQALTNATADGITVTAASCTSKGSVQFQCTNSWDAGSSASQTKEIPALGHDYDEGAITKQPQCEATGTKTSTCKRCKVTSEVPIPATGHSFGSIDLATVTNEQLKQLANDPQSASKGITAHPATCTSRGSLELQCNKTDCDKSSGANASKTIPALGHTYDNGVFLTGEEATCLKDGKKTFTCTNPACDGGTDANGHGKTYKTDVTATGHSYGVINVDEEKKEVTAEALKGIQTDAQKGIQVESGSCTETGKLTLTCQNENCDEKNVKKEYTILSSEHAWEKETYREMTCQNANGKPQTGMVLKTCPDCGATEWEVIQVAHAYEQEDWFATAEAGTDYTVITDRTCTTDGLVNPTCDICGTSGSNIKFPKTGHSFESENYAWPDTAKATASDLEAAGVEDAPSKTPTCTSTGYQYYKCVNDGKCTQDSEAKAVTKHDLPKTAHNYSETAVKKDATCTKPERTAKFCQNAGCDAYEGDVVVGAPAKGHSYDTKKQPTLEQVKEAGIEGITSTDDLSQKGDCLTDAYDYYICDRADCDHGTDYIKKFTTPAKGSHTMVAVPGTIPATCMHPEQMHKKCTDCGYVEPVPIPPGMEDDFDPIQPHDYTDWIRDIVPANCTEGALQNGIAEYGCKYGCGATQAKVITPEHKWKDAEAGDLKTEDYEPGDTTPSKTATCNAAGYQYKICPVCKKVKKETIDKLQHAYTELATAEEDGAAISEDLSQASTCKDNGYEYYRCTQPGCQKTDEGHYEKRQLPLDPSKHDYQLNQHVDASCAEPEKTGELCTICGATKPGTEPTIGAAALGHADKRTGFNKGDGKDLGDYAKLPVSTLHDLEAEGITEPAQKAATCTQPGYEYHNCNLCAQGTTGHAIKVVTAALKHDYTDFEEIPSTCTQAGVLYTKCNTCGDETRQEIASDPAKGHDFQEYPRQEATCTATGKTAGWECSRCGEADLENPQEHPARTVIEIVPDNHVWERIEDHPDQVEPNCTTGTNGKYFYQCKHHPEVKREAVVPPVHQWEAPVMQNCVNAPYTNMPGLLYHTCKLCTKSEVMTTLTDCYRCEADTHKAELSALQAKDPKYKFVVVKPKTEPAVAATCTTEGKTEGKTCSCGKVITAQTTTPLEPHQGEFAVKDPGNCGKDGIKQRKCESCGMFYGETEPFESATSGQHKYKGHITEATCQVPMKVQEICEVCGDKKPAQEVAGTKLPHQFGADGTCTACGSLEVEVATKASANSEGGNFVILTNELAINNADKFELLEAGIFYCLSQSAISSADTQEKQEALLNIASDNGAKKTASTKSTDNITNLRIFNKPINVGTNTNNKIMFRSYVKVMVDGQVEYRYGKVMTCTYNELNTVF